MMNSLNWYEAEFQRFLSSWIQGRRTSFQGFSLKEGLFSELTVCVLATDEVLPGEQRTPYLGITTDGLLQGLHRELGDPVIALQRRTAQHPRVHLAEEALHARSKVDRGVFVDPNSHPAVDHPPEELPHVEDESAAHRFAAAELLLFCAHVVHGQGTEGRADAVYGDGPWQDNPYGTLNLVFGAFGVAQAQALRLPGDPHQSPAHHHREPQQDVLRKGRQPHLLIPAQRARHFSQAPRYILKLG